MLLLKDDNLTSLMRRSRKKHSNGRRDTEKSQDTQTTRFNAMNFSVFSNEMKGNNIKRECLFY